MIGETSYYYPCTIYCRDRFARGDFGRWCMRRRSTTTTSRTACRGGEVAAREGLGALRRLSAHVLPHHSVSMVVSVTGARATHVSCLALRTAP